MLYNKSSFCLWKETIVPIILDSDVLEVAEYVYKTRLSQPYTEVGSEWEYNYKKPTATYAKGDGHNLQRYITIDGKQLHRPIHGLAHTMRTLMYSQLMHCSSKKQLFPHVCQDGRTIADLSELDLKKINIAQLFFVAGRESEASYGDAYHRYHLYGAKQFEEYARKHLTHLFSEEEIQLYSRCIEDRVADSFDGTPEGYIIHLSHMIDLMRCKSPVEVFLGHSKGVSGIVPTLIHLFGKQDGLDIMHYARGLFAATGEAVPYIDSSEWPHLGVDLSRVQRALSIVGDINVPGQEADPKKTAQAGFSVDGCYSALTSVPTPSWYEKELKEVDDEKIDVKEVDDREIEKEHEIVVPSQATTPLSTEKPGSFVEKFLKPFMIWKKPELQTTQPTTEKTNRP